MTGQGQPRTLQPRCPGVPRLPARAPFLQAIVFQAHVNPAHALSVYLMGNAF